MSHSLLLPAVYPKQQTPMNVALSNEVFPFGLLQIYLDHILLETLEARPCLEFLTIDKARHSIFCHLLGHNWEVC